jgi:hypothetical protein
MRQTLTVIGWIAFLAAMAVYLVMVLWSLPFITVEANGQTPFDLRPMGYSVEEAKGFLLALSPKGREFYHSVQHRLDTAYPVLLAMALCIGSVLTAPSTWGHMRWMFVLMPLLGLVADYRENFLVAGLLDTPLPLIGAAQVHAASITTLVKSAVTTLAMCFFLGLLVMWIARKRRTRT